MTEGISVIITYYNESETLETTLDLIASQTLLPNEVLLIDSSSTDGSYDIIQRWIKKNSSQRNIIFRNIQEGTSFPGTSMNVGIRNADFDILAFMDCGLLFENDWLQKQKDYLQSNNTDVVSGLFYFKGVTLLDKTAIAQTYGYQRLRPTVPSSFVRKTVFKKTGLFLENIRAAADTDWVYKLGRKKIKRDTNKHVIIKYNGVNYARSIKDIFIKTMKYAQGSSVLHHYYYHHIYVFCFFCVVGLYFVKILFFRPWPYNEYIPLARIDGLLLFISFKTASYLMCSYIILRGYIIPAFKSQKLSLLYEEPLSIITLPIVGFVIDLGKLAGYIKGITQSILPSIIKKWIKILFNAGKIK